MSDDNSKQNIDLNLKSEVITIDEDEVQINTIEADLKDLPQSTDFCFESLPEKSSYCYYCHYLVTKFNYSLF